MPRFFKSSKRPKTTMSLKTVNKLLSEFKAEKWHKGAKSGTSAAVLRPQAQNTMFCGYLFIKPCFHRRKLTPICEMSWPSFLQISYISPYSDKIDKIYDIIYYDFTYMYILRLCSSILASHELYSRSMIISAKVWPSSRQILQQKLVLLKGNFWIFVFSKWHSFKMKIYGSCGRYESNEGWRDWWLRQEHLNIWTWIIMSTFNIWISSWAFKVDMWHIFYKIRCPKSRICQKCH